MAEPAEVKVLFKARIFDTIGFLRVQSNRLVMEMHTVDGGVFVIYPNMQASSLKAWIPYATILRAKMELALQYLNSKDKEEKKRLAAQINA